jgi:hypothetical protein
VTHFYREAATLQRKNLEDIFSQVTEVNLTSNDLCNTLPRSDLGVIGRVLQLHDILAKNAQQQSNPEKYQINPS